MIAYPVDREFFKDTTTLIFWTVVLAMSTAILAWWLSFAAPMPPIAMTSQTIATTAMLLSYLVLERHEKLAPIQVVQTPLSFSSRLSGWLLNLVLGLQMFQLAAMIDAVVVLHNPGSQSQLAARFASGFLYEIALYAAVFSVGTWLVACCLQASSRRFHKNRTLVSLILFVPFVVAAIQLKFMRMLYENFVGFLW